MGGSSGPLWASVRLRAVLAPHNIVPQQIVITSFTQSIELNKRIRLLRKFSVGRKFLPTGILRSVLKEETVELHAFMRSLKIHIIFVRGFWQLAAPAFHMPLPNKRRINIILF